MLDDLLGFVAIRRLVFPAVALACFGVGPAFAAGDEELLSLTGSQPALAADVRGGFVTIWTDTEAENEGLGIRGCLLAPKKGGCGPHFAVNTTAVGDQIRPSVTADDPGRFVVAWQGAVESGTVVFGQRFGAGGVKLGPELLLSRSSSGILEWPKVAMGEGGDFVATWQNSQDNRIEVARFSAKGKPLGTAFPMETEGETKEKRFPIAGAPPCGDGPCEAIAAVSMDTRGRFVVIWEVTEHGTVSNLFAQLFTPGGKPRTERIPVNATPSMGFETPAVALADNGDVMVAWTRSDTLHPERMGLFLRRMRLQ